jgi:hypothetical protein
VGGSVGKVGSGNAYVYADDMPVMMTDPSGKIACSDSVIGNGIEWIFTAVAAYAIGNAAVGALLAWVMPAVLVALLPELPAIIATLFAAALLLGVLVDLRYKIDLIAQDCGLPQP